MFDNKPVFKGRNEERDLINCIFGFGFSLSAVLVNARVVIIDLMGDVIHEYSGLPPGDRESERDWRQLSKSKKDRILCLSRFTTMLMAPGDERFLESMQTVMALCGRWSGGGCVCRVEWNWLYATMSCGISVIDYLKRRENNNAYRR